MAIAFALHVPLQLTRKFAPCNNFVLLGTWTSRSRNCKRAVVHASLSESPENSDDISNHPSRPSLLVKVLASVLIGVIGGAIGSLIGAGGGIAITPLLTLLMGLTQHQAHGTALCIVSVTAATGTFKYHAAGQVAFPAAAFLTSTALLTAPIGARAASRLNAKRLKLVFGLFLILVSILVPTMPYVLKTTPSLLLSVHAQRLIMMIVGCLAGFLSGLLGIGGGTVMVPALVLLAALSQKLAQGTALCAMLIPSILGSITHFQFGNVVVDLLSGLSIGAVIGGSLGSALALRLKESALRIVCSAIFFAIGMRYVLQNARMQQ